jgi:hypothetical protein
MVAAYEEDVSVQLAKYRLYRFRCPHAEIANVNYGITGAHNGIPILYQGSVHLGNVAEGPFRVLDYLGVTEMCVTDDEGLQALGLSGGLFSSQSTPRSCMI